MFLPEVAAVGAEVGVEAGAAAAAATSDIGAGTAGDMAGTLVRRTSSELVPSTSDVAGSGTTTASGGLTQVESIYASRDQATLPGDNPGSQSSNSLSRITDADNASSGSGESGGNSGTPSLLDGGDDLARFTQPSDQAEQDNKEIERRNNQRSPLTGEGVEGRYRLSGRGEGDGAARDAEDRGNASTSRAQDTADGRARIVSGDSELATPEAIRGKAAEQLKYKMAEDVRNDPRGYDIQVEASQERAALEMTEAQRVAARPQVGREESTPGVHEVPEARASQEEHKPSTELELYRRPVEGETTEPRLRAVRAEAEIVDTGIVHDIVHDEEHLSRSEQPSPRDPDPEWARKGEIEDAEIIEGVELLDEIEVGMADREAARARREEQQARQARMAEELDLSQGEIISDAQWQEIQQQKLQEEQREREQEEVIREQEQMRLRTQAARDRYVQSEVDGLDQDLQDLLNNPEKFGPARPEPRRVGDNEPDAAQPAPRGEGGDEGARGDEEPVGAVARRGSTAMPKASFDVEMIRGNALNGMGNLRQQTLFVRVAASGQAAQTAKSHSHIRDFMKNVGFQAAFMGMQGMAANLGQGAGLADQATQ